MSLPNPSDSLNSPEDRDRQLLLDALAGREFTLADVIGQAGWDFLKGESPVPKLVQLKTELKLFTRQHLQDPSGALQAVLQVRIDEGDRLISQYLDTPLIALQKMVENYLNPSEMLYELVRQVDFRYGQMYGEKPYFQSPGSPAHPDDEYTHESVKQQLNHFLTYLQSVINDDL